MLAIALDAEELEDYNFASLVGVAVNNPKQLKRWKWQSPDHAGTKPMRDPTNIVFDLAMQMTGGKLGNAAGSAESFEKATGRIIGFMDDEGHVFNRHGKEISKEEADMILPMARLQADG